MSGVLISSRPFHPDRNFHLGWRRPLFYGVCDFPKGLVGAGGSFQSVHTEDRRILQEVICGHCRGQP